MPSTTERDKSTESTTLEGVLTVNPIIRNVLAVVAGLIAGSIVNMGLISCGPMFVEPPPGADMTTPEGIKAAMSQMTVAHFLVPLAAHGLGTFAGALIAALIAATHKIRFALVIGAVFLLGGIAMVAMVGGPLWFVVCDLGLAYLPMAWLGGRIGMALITGRGT
jgi:hypothetical protein